MTSMLDELDAMPEEKHMEICHKADELQKNNLSEGEKAVAIRKEVIRLSQISLSDWDNKVADKAAKLIARDYGEVIKKLEDE